MAHIERQFLNRDIFMHPGRSLITSDTRMSRGGGGGGGEKTNRISDIRAAQI